MPSEYLVPCEVIYDCELTVLADSKEEAIACLLDGAFISQTSRYSHLIENSCHAQLV